MADWLSSREAHLLMDILPGAVPSLTIMVSRRADQGTVEELEQVKEGRITTTNPLMQTAPPWLPKEGNDHRCSSMLRCKEMTHTSRFDFC